MDKEFKAALIAVVYLGVILLGAFILLRVIVPAILDAHFAGSLFAASVVGVVGVVGLAYLGWIMIARVTRLLREDPS